MHSRGWMRAAVSATERTFASKESRAVTTRTTLRRNAFTAAAAPAPPAAPPAALATWSASRRTLPMSLRSLASSLATAGWSRAPPSRKARCSKPRWG